MNFYECCDLTKKEYFVSHKDIGVRTYMMWGLENIYSEPIYLIFVLRRKNKHNTNDRKDKEL